MSGLPRRHIERAGRLQLHPTGNRPRGILFHEYEFDKKGECTAADICIPTNQNHANIQKDFEKLVPEIIHEGEKAVRQKLEMLVRAYDPCISCSTHLLEVKFVK
jgi:coenzyme F420-reducing hydrogenase alpha subunit